MVSEGLGGSAAVVYANGAYANGAAPASSAYFWLGAAALLAGAALGQAILALGAARGRNEVREGPARWARSIAALAFAILAATGALILPPKIELGDQLLLPWCAALGAVGAAAGFRPLAAGLPLFALVAGIHAALWAGLAGWLPYVAPGRIATLLPFEVAAAGPGAVARGSAAQGAGSGAARLVGEFATEARDSLPVVQRIEYASSSVSLVVETLELSGPVGYLARTVAWATRGAPIAGDGGSARFYRIVAFAGGAEPLALAPASSSFLGLARLGPDGGFDPGAAASASALAGLVTLSRGASAAIAPQQLTRVGFELGDGPVPSAR